MESANEWIELGTQKIAFKPDLLKKISEILEINYIELYMIVGYLDEKSLNDYVERKNK